MSPITTAPEVTPEDLLRMPDGGKGYELVDGQLKELNVGAESSRVGGRVVTRLENHCEAGHPGWVFPADTSFRCFADAPKKVRRPDGAYIAFDRYTAEQYRSEGHITVCPDLVVEVLSPNDYAAEVNRKIREWLAAGVRLVWQIDPDAKMVFCFGPGRDDAAIRYEDDTLTGDPVLPGFAVPVADLFRLPAGPTAGPAG
jgi:Uma2 family endonuclease